MPIYEYYCEPCNTVFSFYSKTINVSKQPDCPQCQAGLTKYVSSFSMGGSTKGPEDMPMSSERIEAGMQKFSTEIEKIKDRDPREAARMRKNFETMAGVSFEEDRRKAAAEEEDLKDAQPDQAKHPAWPRRDSKLYEL
ncbi:MAG: zinc ribbon domain-containing protein [Deltaproteobacteria bacterium]|nr:zinc ribbon domain-containing protein [Deltaproteobacteria bacterium]